MGFSSVPWPTGSTGGHDGRFSRDRLPVFSAGDPCEQFWYGQACPLFDVVYPAFSLLITAVAHPPKCPEEWLWRGSRGV